MIELIAPYHHDHDEANGNDDEDVDGGNSSTDKTFFPPEGNSPDSQANNPYMTWFFPIFPTFLHSELLFERQ